MEAVRARLHPQLSLSSSGSSHVPPWGPRAESFTRSDQGSQDWAMLPEDSECPWSAQRWSTAHLGLVWAAPHGLHELLHLLSLVQRVPQRVFCAHQLVLQPFELGRRGRVNEGIAPLVRQGLLFVLDAAGERKSMRVSVSAHVCTCVHVCAGGGRSLL